MLFIWQSCLQGQNWIKTLKTDIAGKGKIHFAENGSFLKSYIETADILNFFHQNKDPTMKIIITEEKKIEKKEIAEKKKLKRGVK